MATKKRKQQSQESTVVSYFADVFLVNIYRIAKYLVSKKPEFKAILVFDVVALALEEYVLYLLGRIKIFNQGDFRFMWIFGGIMLAPIIICGLIGMLRRWDEATKATTLDEYIESKKPKPAPKNNPSVIYFSQEQLDKMIQDNPDLEVEENEE